MKVEEFAASRRARLERADDDLHGTVRRGIDDLIDGQPDWADDIIADAAVLWLEVFEAEAPEANRGVALARFRREIAKSLEKTAVPDENGVDASVNRVTYWLSTYTVNNATVAGAFRRGVKFKRWTTMHDAHVREMHDGVDGQITSIGGTFDVGGHNLAYPGEPVGPPDVWINCRCLAMPAARDGETMSGTTYTIGPEDDVLDDNPDIIPGSDIIAAASTPEVDTEPLPEIDEEGLVPDEPEDDEELITEIPVHGVLAPEGVPTGDGRMFALEALSTRDLPVPLLYEYVHSHGGDTSMTSTVGRVDKAWRDEATNMWRWTGAIVLSTQYAQETIDGMVQGLVRGVSIDGDAAELEVREIDDDADLMDLLMGGGEEVYAKMRVAGLTIVPIPAFQEAYIALGHEFQEDLTDEEFDAQLVALQACGCMSPESEEDFRDVSTEERERLAGEGAAMPDGSYPIANCEDLRNAIQAIGRAKDPEATKAHIRKRKSALGCDEVELPEDWGAEIVAFVDTHDGPGWITHPIPTQRIRNYWTRGEGAAKIRWGVAGDFNRCRMQLAKYVQNPDWLAGLCANMHYEALKFWPAQHHGSKVIVASAAFADRAPIARLVRPEHPVYPAEFFAEPTLDRAYPLKIDRDTRRVHGYVSEWGVCHVGMAGMCQEVPQSYTDYAYFKKGVVDTTEGEQFVGCLTFAGHASRYMSMAKASDYYDKPDAVRAYVNVGENAYGVWFSGVIPPEVSDEDITKMRAIGAVSGDWREVRGQLELIGVPIVNTPGLPVRQLAASAGRQTVMIGAGALKPDVLVAAATMGIDPELVGAIARTAVAEYRHQEKVLATAGPARQKVREHTLAVARARVERG